VLSPWRVGRLQVAWLRQIKNITRMQLLVFRTREAANPCRSDVEVQKLTE